MAEALTAMDSNMTSSGSSDGMPSMTSLDMQTTESMLGLRGPLFNSIAERFATEMYLWLSLVLTLALNGIVCYILIRYEQFHTPYYASIFCIAVADGLLPLIAVPEQLAAIYLDSDDIISTYSCKMPRSIRISIAFYQPYALLLLAVERTYYFYRPIAYASNMKIRHVIISHSVGLLIAIVVSAVFMYLGEDKVSLVTMNCLSDVPHFNTTGVFMFYVPNVLFNVVCVGALSQLLLKHKRAIAQQQAILTTATAPRQNENKQDPGPGSNVSAGKSTMTTKNADGNKRNAKGNGKKTTSSHQAESSNRSTQSVDTPSPNSQVVQLKATLKLILCTSCSFWLTLLPAVIVLYVFRSRVEYDVLERAMADRSVTITYRLAYLFLFSSCYINPIINIVINKPLLRCIVREIPCLKCFYRAVSPANDVPTAGTSAGPSHAVPI